MSEVVHCHRCDILDLAPGTTECFGCEQPPLRDTACETCEGTGYRVAENWHENEVQDCPDFGGTGRREGRVVTLTIPGCPAYSLSPNSRCHWRVKHRESQAAKWDVKMAIADQFCGFPPRFRGPVRIIWGINLAKRRKFMDRDNATATLKPFMDALVELGIIDGDTPDIVTDIQIHQFLYKEHGIAEGEIEVTIQEVTA